MATPGKEEIYISGGRYSPDHPIFKSGYHVILRGNSSTPSKTRYDDTQVSMPAESLNTDAGGHQKHDAELPGDV